MGLGNTTSESSTPTTVADQLVTPVVVPAESVRCSFNPGYLLILVQDDLVQDDSLRRVVDNNQNLSAAQGAQQNEMSRYLHGMSDQIEDANRSTQKGLAGMLDDIGSMRESLKPKHVLGHVLPDGRVVLANGDIVEGIRGAPASGVVALQAPPLSRSHVEGSILPDGTVLADGKVVDGVQGAPTLGPMTEVAEETFKNMEQDRKLGTLQDQGWSY